MLAANILYLEKEKTVGGHENNYGGPNDSRAAEDTDVVQEDHIGAAGEGVQPHFSFSSGNENVPKYER